MGVSLHLGTVDSPLGDTKHCGKSFSREILFASSATYFNSGDFLNEEEQELLRPDYCDGDTSITNFRQLNPLKLKTVFEKVYNHLKTNSEKFPLVHMIYKDENYHSGSSISDDFNYNGFRCHLYGYHNVMNHRQELQLERFNDGWETWEWIGVQPKIAIGNKLFYIETQNKFEQYQNNLEELIEICRQAANSNKNLIWHFTN